MKRWIKRRRVPFAISLLVAGIVFVGVVSLIALAPSTQEWTPLEQAQQSTLMPNADETRDEQAVSMTPDLPLQLSVSSQVNRYHRADTLESWKILSEKSCADFALIVLEAIHAQKGELLQAGFMDLSGECWGCVFTENGNSISVMLMPEHPFSPRSEDNLLVVSILHYLEQEGFV